MLCSGGSMLHGRLWLALPPGIASPVTPLMTLLTLSAVPAAQQVVLSSSGLARAAGDSL